MMLGVSSNFYGNQCFSDTTVFASIGDIGYIG